MRPHVSIVVAVHNVEKKLPRCLESLAEQTEPHIEVILVDDGSTDRSGVLCDNFRPPGALVKVIHQSNKGLSGARNSGIEAATGEYLLFVDGDDWVESNMVEEMLARMHEIAADVIVFGYFVENEDADGRTVECYQRVPDKRTIIEAGREAPRVSAELVNLVGYAWNKMYRTELIRQSGVRFTEGISLVEDVLFNAAIFPHCRRVMLEPEAFLHYVQYDGTATLGTAYYPRFADLRLQAIDKISDVLAGWGIDGAAAASVLNPIRANIMTATVRRVAERPSWSLGRKVDELRRIRVSTAVTEGLLGITEDAAVPFRQRMVAHLFLDGRFRTLALAGTIRVRGRRVKSCLAQ